MQGARSNRSDRDRLEARILAWLARLPIVGDEHLQALLDTDAAAAAAALTMLRRRGLAASSALDSPEFAEPRTLHHLTVAGATAIAHAMGITTDELERRLPVDRREVLTHLARVETALAVAWFVATLAEDIRAEEGLALDDAWSSHWAPRCGPALLPPAVEACLRLRAGDAAAPFLLA